MAKATRFGGPVHVGRYDPTPANDTRNPLPIVKRLPVSADGAYPFTLPACDIINAWINTETAWEGSAGTTTTLRFGTSADNDLYGSLVLSAAGSRFLTLSAASLLALSSGRVLVDVTTVGTAGVGLGSFYVQYLQSEES